MPSSNHSKDIIGLQNLTSSSAIADGLRDLTTSVKMLSTAAQLYEKTFEKTGIG